MCIPFYVFHTRPFVSVHFFLAAKWLTGRSSELTSAFGFVLDPQPLLVAPACPTKAIVDILDPSDYDFKIPQDLSWWSCKCSWWCGGSKQWQCSAGRPIAMDPNSLPTRSDRKKKLWPEKKTRSSLITSVSLSNDCTAGDLQYDWSSLWMRPLVKTLAKECFTSGLFESNSVLYFFNSFVNCSRSHHTSCVSGSTVSERPFHWSGIMIPETWFRMQ